MYLLRGRTEVSEAVSLSVHRANPLARVLSRRRPSYAPQYSSAQTPGVYLTSMSRDISSRSRPNLKSITTHHHDTRETTIPTTRRRANINVLPARLRSPRFTDVCQVATMSAPPRGLRTRSFIKLRAVPSIRMPHAELHTVAACACLPSLLSATTSLRCQSDAVSALMCILT